MNKVEISLELTSQPKARPNEEAYGFGRYFSDHMFVVDYSEALGWHSPRVTPYQPLTIDPGAAVLHYGQAIFEGMKAFRGIDDRIRLFRPQKNFERMKASAERLCMQFISEPVFLAGIEKLVKTDASWVPSRLGTALYLRPTLIATEAFLGVRPSLNYTYYVIACPVGGYYGETIEPVKIWIEREYSRAARGGMGAAKAGGNYAASLAAAVKAKKRGYSQVMWLDAAEKKYVEEVGTMNVFFRLGDTIVTPPLGGTILPGVTRDSVLQLLRGWGHKVEERPITIDEILKAHDQGLLKEVFGTGTAVSISPVASLGMDDRVLTISEGKPGPVSNELYDTLTGIQYGRLPDERGWTRVVESAHPEFGSARALPRQDSVKII